MACTRPTRSLTESASSTAVRKLSPFPLTCVSLACFLMFSERLAIRSSNWLISWSNPSIACNKSLCCAKMIAASWFNESISADNPSISPCTLWRCCLNWSISLFFCSINWSWFVAKTVTGPPNDDNTMPHIHTVAKIFFFIWSSKFNFKTFFSFIWPFSFYHSSAANPIRKRFTF